MYHKELQKQQGKWPSPDIFNPNLLHSLSLEDLD
jgi:hypothetical protein